MDTIKSLEYSKVLTAMLCDVQTKHSNVFTSAALKKTLIKVLFRYRSEGIGFLTKTLPQLGKGLDKALACHEPLDSTKYAFKSMPGSKLPKFLGELFQMVLDNDGAVLPNSDVSCVRSLREILFSFYKLELEADPKLEQKVISGFIATENEIKSHNTLLGNIASHLDRCSPVAYPDYLSGWARRTIRKARITLNRVFQTFDHTDIYPRHGPGAVSTKETLWGKYSWSTISPRITEIYPLDSYFYASLGHFCDSLQGNTSVVDFRENSARVVLVPKDSRGPRLISCEPLDFQWIQQGLSRAIVRHVEDHPITKWSVRFTDQQPNGLAALLGSQDGRYATLDLKEASDRVTIGLVRLLFPEPLRSALMACRSLSTELPDGQVVTLNKYAPMGSALCFPVLALCVWSLLYSGLKAIDANAVQKDDIYVYGDDVIVPVHLAEHAMNILESFGLKINRDKSCTKGLFRESCGVDAYKGEYVTPVRFRTPWGSSRCPNTFVSWVSYANSLYERGYFKTYDYIVDRLYETYGPIPERSSGLSAPSLHEVPDSRRPYKRRWNSSIQRLEYKVLEVQSKSVQREIDGWSMLLRYFAEACSSHHSSPTSNPASREASQGNDLMSKPFSVRAYTYRKRNKLCYRWR